MIILVKKNKRYRNFTKIRNIECDKYNSRKNLLNQKMMLEKFVRLIFKNFSDNETQELNYINHNLH